MTDSGKIKRKMLLSLLASPVTAMPFLAGVTALVGTWAMGVRPDLGIFAGIAGVLASAGVFYTKLVLGGETYAAKAIQEVQHEERAEKERALDDLARRLAGDRDPRTDAALRDLRTLMRAFDDFTASGALDVNTTSATSIGSGVRELFDQSVHSLEWTLRLWQTAKTLTTKVARDPILKQREQILQDIADSIQQLGQTLVALQSLGTGEGAKSDLTRIGEELDQHLNVARQVEERVRSFDRQLDTGVRE